MFTGHTFTLLLGCNIEKTVQPTDSVALMHMLYASDPRQPYFQLDFVCNRFCFRFVSQARRLDWTARLRIRRLNPVQCSLIRTAAHRALVSGRGRYLYDPAALLDTLMVWQVPCRSSLSQVEKHT